MEEFSSAPLAWRLGPQRWISAVTLPITSSHGVTETGSVFLDALTSDPPCIKADVRVSHEMKSGLFRSQASCVQSEKGLTVGDVYDAMNELSDRLYCKATSEKKQTSIRKEHRIFMPCDIHPVTIQEWEYVRSLRAEI